MIDPDAYVTPVEAADLTGSSAAYWKRECLAGRVAGAIQLGRDRKWYIPRESLRAVPKRGPVPGSGRAWRHSAGQLIELLSAENDANRRPILMALIALRMGFGKTEAAFRSGLSVSTVSRRLRDYRKVGLEAALTPRPPGRPVSPDGPSQSTVYRRRDAVSQT